MEKLDLKDRKILYHLDLNSRESFRSIGRKVGLSKDVVASRVKRMEDEGVIRGYWTIIDSYRFGYQVYRYYIIFQNATSEKKEEIMQELVKYKNSLVVNALRGLYDMAGIFWVKSIPQFYNFWDAFNEKYGDFFAEKIFSVYLHADAYPLSYLLLPDELNKSDRDKYLQTMGGKETEIDWIDYKFLFEIVENARIPIIKLSDKLGFSSQSIKNRMKNLIKKGIIQGFRVDINPSKFGFKEFKVDIWLKEVSKRKKLWYLFKYNPYVTFINTSAGYADLEIEFTIENADKLVDMVDEVSSKFPDAVRKYIYFTAKKGYKLRCLPEMTESDFISNKK